MQNEKKKTQIRNKKHRLRIKGNRKMLLKLWIISVSLSIDALGIGMSYRLKGVKIPLLAKIIVGVMVTGVSCVALLIGNKIVEYLPENLLKVVTAVLLVMIGMVFIRKGMHKDTAAFCDINESATIEPCEAILLGIGLSMDSVATGIAVVAIGIQHILLPILIGVNHILFLVIGECMGEKTMAMAGKSQRICNIFSGGLLVIIGILHGIG